MPDFYVAYADQTGAKIAASERQLSPAPTRVEYPTDPTGKQIETADGRVVQQQPPKDNRKRAWVWVGYPAHLTAYKDLWKLLESLRARYRLAYGAATPYVWLKDATTEEFRRLVTVAGTATSGGSNTLTDTGASFGTLTGYELEIVQGTGAGQVRTISSNNSTQITVSPDWSVNPASGSKYAVRGYAHDWFRVRVLEVSRKVQDADRGGSLTYEETRLVFTIEDTAWNFFG